MSFLLDRNLDNGQYELKHLDQVLARYSVFDWALDKAQRAAKNHRTKLYLTKACISDWYVGFPNKGEPILFHEPDPVVAAAKEGEYKFVEGPFCSADEARTAIFRISGKKVR